MLTEREIIIKIKNGEIDYYSLIVRKYTQTVYRYIKSKINNRDDAEDLTQNTFISFYKAVGRFNEDKPVKPYLFKIVTNELKMFYRSRKPAVKLNEEIFIEDDRSAGFETTDDYLKPLSNKERKIFIYLDEGYKYGEIARKLHRPVNTVKSIIRRARIRLKYNRK